ncbi:putative PurR-regulated permease PerM [Filimonas zeae]|uniref:AI-2E family transporter n=1 Tax=Filimonas zeae TaxID=1737353 RepID=A0A917J1B0_9BACT|nr:AI-2E family transporter [Filimonas zeae]MDR6340647.1 putative PurR-regulated permease PerM [Filimonas zeae]GGH73716.1 AI-2E family transporter [Filimonas zeae]
MQSIKILKAAAVLAIPVLLIAILVAGKPFFVPICFAGLLAMLLLPVARWLQRNGWPPVVSILCSMLLLALALAGIVLFISWQVSDIAENAGKLEQEIARRYQELRTYIATEYGISPEKQQQMLKEQQSGSSGKAASIITGIISGLGSFLTNLLLVFVYIFLFMHFRGRIKGFIIRLVPQSSQAAAIVTIQEVQQVIQKYLGGLALMIAMLWVMYGIGFSIAGVKNALFFAILCGLLEIVPFVGNLTGTAVTLLMALVQGGGTNLIIGILVTYALVQFIQSYLLEPLVVGAEVNINPMATIVGLVAGEFIWGIPGMILAIPLMGMLKIICDHVPALQPYAYLMGQEKKQDDKKKRQQPADA